MSSLIPAHGTNPYDAQFKALWNRSHHDAGNDIDDVFNVKNPVYGAIGDGSNNDTTAVAAAITACAAAGGGTVLFPPGTYKITSTLNVTHSSVALVGSGSGSQPGAVQQPALAPTTTIKWAGGANPVIKWEYVQGCRASDFLVDGGTTASHGLYLDSFQYGTLARIGVYNTVAETGIACFMGAQVNTANTQFNSFEDLFLDGASCLYLTGNRPTLTYDVTGNLFRNLCCTYSNTNSAAGVVVDFADGNDFQLLYIFGKSSTGIALDLKDQARNNFFWHLYAGGNDSGNVTRARTPAFAGFSNTAFFTAAGNLDGAPDPVIDSGAIFNYWTQSNASVERFVTNTQITAPHLSLREQALREAQGVTGETWPRQLGTGGNQPTGGSIYASAVGLVKGDIVTDLLCVVAAGGTSTTVSRLGLFDSGFNLLAKTADQGSGWNTAGDKTVALTSPYTVTATGLYYIAVIANASSAIPYLWRVVPNDAVAPGPFSGGAGYLWVFESTTGRTDFPSSFSATLGSGPCFWFGWA